MKLCIAEQIVFSTGWFQELLTYALVVLKKTFMCNSFTYRLPYFYYHISISCEFKHSFHT